MPRRMIQVSNDPHTFESVPGYRVWALVGAGIIEGILGWQAYIVDRDSISTGEQVLVGLSTFVVAVAFYYYVRDQSDRVVVSAEGVREFHRKRKGTGWVLIRKTPCEEWAEARASTYYEDDLSIPRQHYLKLVHKSYKNNKRIVLASSLDLGAVFGFMDLEFLGEVFGAMDFESLMEFENTAAEINEILKHHRADRLGSP